MEKLKTMLSVILTSKNDQILTETGINTAWLAVSFFCIKQDPLRMREGF